MEQLFRTKAGETVLICSMQQDDLDAADYVTRLAFGTLMLANGYTTNAQGIVMQQPDAGYNREDVFLIDDWR